MSGDAAAFFSIIIGYIVSIFYRTRRNFNYHFGIVFLAVQRSVQAVFYGS